MTNIDMKSLEHWLEQAEDDIENGRVMEFEQAMKEIPIKFFGEEL